MKAVLSSTDGRWHEVPDDIAKASDPARVAEIIETDPPSADESVDVSSEIVDVGGKPVRTYSIRTKSAVELRRYLRPLAFYDRLPNEVLLELCRQAQKDPAILLMLLRLASALFLESDDPALTQAVDALVQAGFPIDKAKLFGGWDRRPPVAADGGAGIPSPEGVQ